MKVTGFVTRWGFYLFDIHCLYQVEVKLLSEQQLCQMFNGDMPIDTAAVSSSYWQDVL